MARKKNDPEFTERLAFLEADVKWLKNEINEIKSKIKEIDSRVLWILGGIIISILVTILSRII